MKKYASSFQGTPEPIAATTLCMSISERSCHGNMHGTTAYYIEWTWLSYIVLMPGRHNFYTVREKGRDLTKSYDKSYTDRKIIKAMWQHKNATKNFDYTTIADRLRTFSWGNDSHPTGVVKPVYGIPTFPLTAKVV